MIEGHLHEWGNLLVRWIHFIVGVAWIGASFYFNWLENNLNRQSPGKAGIAGHLWAVHGGGFYYLEKFKTGPEKLPVELHWFKWEAYLTWLSGITLLIIVYYFNARLFLIDPAVRDLSPAEAIILSTVSVLGSWFVYDILCRSPLQKSAALLGITIAGYLVLLAWFLSEVFSGRGAYIHVGAVMGTMMVGNVFFVIIPSQKEMVRALAQKRPLNPAVGANGLLRSTHNNYFTLPVLFTMISSHFPSTYGHHWNWAILFLISAASVAVRHYYNVRRTTKSLWWILPVAFVGMLGVMWWTAPTLKPAEPVQGDIRQSILPLIQERCTVCHSETPTQRGFTSPPVGLVLDTPEQIETNSLQIYQATVVTRTMPIGNLTGMTDEERNLISLWYSSRNTDRNSP